MKKSNNHLRIISLIALVNMIGYGIIIPVIYAYSKKFGLSDFENGALFAIYSLCQFISTPIIGRLSDKYGRRPLLLISILGTAISFFLMAFAPNALFLVLARALDGFTAGNIPVAFAVISDTTPPQERSKAFGKIGSAFSFGFVFGPAISALTVGYSLAAPFIIAGIISLLAVIITYIYLPETNPHIGQVQEGRLFDFAQLANMLFDPSLGTTFCISFLLSLAFSGSIIFGFQLLVQNVLDLSTTVGSYLFTLMGIVGLMCQNFVVYRVSKYLGSKRAFELSLLGIAVAILVMGNTGNLQFFVLSLVLLAFANSLTQTLLPTIISLESEPKQQGAMMGLNASYQSIAMILGPLLGGWLALTSIRYTFDAGAIIMVACFVLSFFTLRLDISKGHH